MILHRAGGNAQVRAPFEHQGFGGRAAGKVSNFSRKRVEGFWAMIDMDVARFDVRAVSRNEERQHLSYTKNMLLATTAASLAIVGLGAFFLSLWI